MAGIGGFSGKESSVSVAWLEERIASGAIAWIYTSGLGGSGTDGGGGAPPAANRPSEGAPGGRGGDSRTGSESAIDTVVKSCTEVETSEYDRSTSESAIATGGSGTLYKCGAS